ncbi:Uncharacterized protein dnl_31180 [Desulfonema limicola]|uniref:Uncharacterized protein n=1 Tax=Desulfonema limicola TaxID=45656 RepID=A0A975GGX7_9BACT|nr:hypothetical protein [Desulfonema limicola]QTA80805.1 Uncharacterized protein dnl_31180 [Desulfonema limicola]
MKTKTICFFILLFLWVLNVSASELREIELNDGSIISGEVISLDNGVYTLKSQSMGILKIDDSKIREIRKKRGSSVPLNSFAGTDIQSMTQSLMGNENIMKMIMGLQNDPEIQKILQSPEIMEAVNAGDITALMSEPEFRKLLENPKIQGITEQMTK